MSVSVTQKSFAHKKHFVFLTPGDCALNNCPVSRVILVGVAQSLQVTVASASFWWPYGCNITRTDVSRPVRGPVMSGKHYSIVCCRTGDTWEREINGRSEREWAIERLLLSAPDSQLHTLNRWDGCQKLEEKKNLLPIRWRLVCLLLMSWKAPHLANLATHLSVLDKETWLVADCSNIFTPFQTSFIVCSLLPFHFVLSPLSVKLTWSAPFSNNWQFLCPELQFFCFSV